MAKVYVAFEVDIDGIYDAAEEEKMEAVKVLLESGAESTNIDIKVMEIRFDDVKNNDEIGGE